MLFQWGLLVEGNPAMPWKALLKAVLALFAMPCRSLRAYRLNCGGVPVQVGDVGALQSRGELPPVVSGG